MRRPTEHRRDDTENHARDKGGVKSTESLTEAKYYARSSGFCWLLALGRAKSRSLYTSDTWK